MTKRLQYVTIGNRLYKGEFVPEAKNRTNHLNERNVRMAKPISTKKMIKLLLSLVATVVIFFAVSLSASAASYPEIRLNVPRVSQCPGRGDCAIASMASVEAYCHGLPAGNHNSEAYQAVYSANGYSVVAIWSRLGYEPVDGFNMTMVYNQLKTGYPVVVHRTSQHYSVIYGYDGNSSNLELSGFLVMDVDDSYNSSTAYFRLNSWKRSGNLDRMVIRKNGLAIPTNGINITTNHPAQSTARGEFFSAYGTIVSGSNITSVTVKVTTPSGTVKQSYSATPNAKSFALSKANERIDIASLTPGSYVYSIVAKNAAGNTASRNFNFAVGVASAGQPSIEILEVSYRAVVTAEPYLNMRRGAGIEYEKITEIPEGEIVNVTGECNGWARVAYDGKTGWVSKDYITEYTSAPDTDNSVSNPTTPSIFASYYARTKNAVSLKESASVFSTTLVAVPKNTIVKVIGESNGWIKFAFGGKVGWIRATSTIQHLGDPDGNGSVNSADSLLILRFSTGNYTFSQEQKNVSDFNGDGSVNSADALKILQVVTGEIRYD